MPDTITPGQICYEHYWPGLAQHSPSLVSDPPVAWDALPTGVQAAWDAAAKAVLIADSDGRHTTTASFRYAIGDVLRLGTLGPWTVCSRRWIERESMPAYAEYLVELEPEGTTQWEGEADLTPWEAP